MTKTELPPLPECDSYCTHADDHEYDVFTAEQMHAYARTALAPLEAELERMRMDAAKSLRREIMFGDIIHQHVLAMRAAVVDGHLRSPSHGMQWIVNTLEGPGHLPDLDEASALGGAQALFDKEMAEHEAFRAAHPGPAADTKGEGA
jgi:hypothetical protein